MSQIYPISVLEIEDFNRSVTTYLKALAATNTFLSRPIAKTTGLVLAVLLYRCQDLEVLLHELIA